MCIYNLILCLFSQVFLTMHRIIGWLNGDWWLGQDFKWSSRDLFYDRSTIPQISWRKWVKGPKISIHRYFKPEPPDYEAGVIGTQSRLLVNSLSSDTRDVTTLQSSVGKRKCRSSLIKGVATEVKAVKAVKVQTILMRWDWVHLVLRPLFHLLYHPQMIDDDDCGAIGGMKIDRGNRSTRRKPVPVPLCLPQIPHDLTLARILGAAVGSRRLTAWAMAWPLASCISWALWEMCPFCKILLESGVWGVEVFLYSSTRLVIHFSVSSDRARGKAR
jgi:hypothetical protein